MTRGFVGWSPTITGRISFSRVGAGMTAARCVCNSTSRDDGWIFGSELRTSRDGPFPPWMMRLVGRIPDVHFLVDLDVVPAELPVNDGGDTPSMDEDRRGALAGEVLFFTNGVWARGGLCAERLRRIRILAARARNPHLTDAQRDHYRGEAAELRAQIWESLKRCFYAEDPVPAFGRARVHLLRSGECTIRVDQNDLYLTDALKAAQAEAGPDQPPVFDSHAAEEAVNSVARQVFFFVKDLAHNHYHHDPHADLLVTPTDEAKGDQQWRQDTQYGLARLVIARRRDGSALAYREALGLIAYAEAFQKHFCGWYRPAADKPPVKLPSAFNYDFAALKSSVEASLKVREYKDGANRQSALFLFGFLLTALGLLFAAKRLLNTGSDGKPLPETPKFDSAVAVIASNPTITLIAVSALAVTVDQVFIRQTIPRLPLASLVGGLARASDAVMATTIRKAADEFRIPFWISRRWLGFAIGAGVVVTTLIMFVGLAALGLAVVSRTSELFAR